MNKKEELLQERINKLKVKVAKKDNELSLERLNNRGLKSMVKTRNKDIETISKILDKYEVLIEEMEPYCPKKLSKRYYTIFNKR